MATRVGYGGGSHRNPTYHDVGDHVEVVEVTFDPRKISYQELLNKYWGSFPTWLPPVAGRTSSAVLTRGEAQQAIVEAAKRERERRTGEPVYVDVVPEGSFYPAERLHQKFYLQKSRPELVRELARGDIDGFLGSTAAARLNAYLKGMAGEDALADAAEELGWDVEKLRARLREEGR